MLVARKSLVTRLARLEARSATIAEERQRTLTSLRDHPAEVMTRAGLDPDPWQQQVLTSTMAQMLLLCTRQAGKSTVAAALAVRAALLQSSALVLVLSPSLRQSGELFRKVLGHFNALGRPVAVTGESVSIGQKVVQFVGLEGGRNGLPSEADLQREMNRIALGPIVV